MKKLLRWALAVLTWEFLVLQKKDKEFTKELKTKQWLSKVSYIFDKLLSFNTDLFHEAKSTVESLDKETLQEHYDAAKQSTKKYAKKTVKKAADHVKKTADNVSKNVKE